MRSVELRQRVERFLRGDRRVEDLDRMYLGLRDRSCGRASVREIGDFVAHREQREKGPVTDKVRDIQLGLEAWLNQLEGRFPDLPAARRIAAANLRTATDEQLAARLDLRREVARSALGQAVSKLERGRHDDLTPRERDVFNYLAGAFIWNPTFTDDRVAEDLRALLLRAEALRESETAAFDEGRAFLALYVTALMHGSAVVMEDGSRFDLFGGFGNEEGRIEVKARIELAGWKKPISAPVCVFWTRLLGSERCSEELAASPASWPGSVEIDRSGRLASIA